ncbi:S8 family serine peptidase [Mycolicibacterium doricum]|nr:S8 family serine peptidase [Mycolicibacterium doricum]MCV7269950.1 S8 family serine peptidase [Mycolicibacterium doricum]
MSTSQTMTPATPGAPDPLRVNQWALDAARLPGAWEHSTGSGQVIAIVDTGVDPAHPDLAGKLVGGYDVLTNSTEAADPHGHGTHVAGIAAAAANNGIGIIGAAPDAKIMPVRALDANGAGSDDTIAAGIDWATEHGANVINLSLGESGLAGRLSKGGPINAAIRRAGAAGVVVVGAAGNDSDRKRVYRIGVPVMVVVASDQNGQPTGFTNTGDLRSIAAPGQDILSTAPIGPTTGWPQGTDGYATLSGTSMASPLVAGVAALLLAQGRSAEQVMTILADTATNPSADRRLGAGIIDAAAAVTA